MPNQPTLEIILEAALEIQGLPERAAYLDEACVGDQALRDEVGSLIAAHLADGTFMDSAAGPLWCEVRSGKEGDMIGRYKLLRQIGEGGFGAVYLAEQSDPVKRQVALKIIKPGMDSREIIARFEAERQVLALMDHPHIAKVHDAGTTEGGRPYFVMELVKGVLITKFCAGNDLDTRQRLELFTDVCAAVQHAHQKGIIHRDLKPSNILVSTHDGKPMVKVIDFGIAKAIGMELTGKTSFTQFGRMIGTPQYMSPEQAEPDALNVDTRSDIYSLGVILYELLTGTTPLDGERLRHAAYAEMQRLIREETPLKPSTKLAESLAKPGTSNFSRGGVPPRALRGDLDWIVLKALEKDPARRYESAGSMAEDLLRFLQHKPVEARPPSMAYLMLRFTRRHRGPVFAGAALLLALVLGAVGTTIGMNRALDAKEELVGKNDELDRQKLALVDYKERLAGLLESNQKMLGEISKLNTSEARLPTEFEALRQENQALLDKVGNELANQERYAQEIKRLQQEKAQLENRFIELFREREAEQDDGDTGESVESVRDRLFKDTVVWLHTSERGQFYLDGKLIPFPTLLKALATPPDDAQRDEAGKLVITATADGRGTTEPRWLVVKLPAGSEPTDNVFHSRLKQIAAAADQVGLQHELFSGKNKKLGN